MSQSYTPYHPRWHRQRVSTYWWLQRRTYLLFILRELSSVFVAWAVAFLLMPFILREQFLAWAAHPLIVLLNLVTFAFLVLHAVTWFYLAPQAMDVRFRGQRVPAGQILLGNYGAWALASLVVALVLLLA